MNPYPNNFDMYERHTALRDYSQIHTGTSDYFEICPKNIAEARAALKYAQQTNTPIRIRGAGHSMNGTSLPRKKELLINTQAMNHFAFEEPDTITVEAGTNLWDLGALLKRYGYDLPVKNGGWSGPTVGGFIAAGGISPTKQKDDGFWNYVREITCLSIDAEKMLLTRQDPLFAYLFGASGQLGLIASTKLDIVPFHANLVSYPLHISGQVPQFYSRATPFKDSQCLTWFCCFGAVEKTQEMRSALEIFFKGHQMLFNKTEVQIYNFKHRDLHVPLLHTSRGDFAGVEIRGLVPLTESQSPRLLELVDAYTKMVENAGYQHYSQVELARIPSCPNPSLSTQTQEALLKLKKNMDPQGRMNAPGY